MKQEEVPLVRSELSVEERRAWARHRNKQNGGGGVIGWITDDDLPTTREVKLEQELEREQRATGRAFWIGIAIGFLICLVVVYH